MEVWFILFTIILLTVIMISFGYHYDLYRRRKVASCGIKNWDDLEKEFCYRISEGKAEIIEKLKLRSQQDILKYDYDVDTSEITFFTLLPEGYRSVTYMMVLREGKGFCVMKIVLKTFYLQGDHHYYAKLQNEFWQKKIGAEPIPYFK